MINVFHPFWEILQNYFFLFVCSLSNCKSTRSFHLFQNILYATTYSAKVLWRKTDVPEKLTLCLELLYIPANCFKQHADSKSSVGFDLSQQKSAAETRLLFHLSMLLDSSNMPLEIKVTMEICSPKKVLFLLLIYLTSLFSQILNNFKEKNSSPISLVFSHCFHRMMAFCNCWGSENSTPK